MRAVWLLPLACLLGACASAPPAVEHDPVFYPPAPAEPRIQYLTHLSSSDQVAPEQGWLAKLTFGDEIPTDAVEKPYGLALSGHSIYVCDTKRSVVNIFDLGERRFGYLGVDGPGRLQKPINLCVDAQGAKYVADAQRAEVVVFGPTDAFQRAIGGGRLERPVDVALHAGQLYVCDAKACQVLVFDAGDGRFLRRIGEKGSAEGHLARPTNIALDPEGLLYVSDTLNGRVQVFDANGSFLRKVGSLGDRAGQFARPKGLAVDREGRLYVADAAFENVQIFDREGRLLLFFGGAGNEPGQLNLPAQVVIDYEHVGLFEEWVEDGFRPEYLVLVTSQYGPRKVNVFAFGHREGQG